MMEIKCYKSPLIALQYIFNLGADLPRAEFLGGRFAEGRFGKWPNCSVPIDKSES